MRSLVSAFSKITPAGNSGDKKKKKKKKVRDTVVLHFNLFIWEEEEGLTVWTPGRSFAHSAIQPDLQVEVVQVRGRLQVNVSPWVPPVGANQRRGVRSRLPEREALEDGEQQRQHGVPHPKSPVYVHHGALFPLRAAASFQMLCCPKVWRQFLFKAHRVPLLLTSLA